MSVSAERWQEVRRILDDVIELPPGRREARLQRSGAGEATLAEVRALLAAADEAPEFLEGEPPAAETPDIASYASLPKGSVIGAFTVDELVGRGGHGEVYLARRTDGHFEQVAALKMLRPEAIDFFQRFQLERQILADLDHPGIARLIDGGIAPDGRPFTAMEFVEGRDIDLHCTAFGLDLKQRLQLFGQVCAAVAYAHRHLVIHRDLKPGNIRVTEDGQVKLLDFGIARLVAATGEAATATQAISTPAYAAPEQLEGVLPTTSTDVYALGTILCELMTGTNPWQPGRLSASVMLRRLLDEDPPPPSRLVTAVADPPARPEQLRGDLDAIVLKAMRREPERRYDTAQAMRDDIERHLHLRPVLARVGTPGYLLRRFVRRNRGRIAAAVTVVIALLGGVAGVVWQATQTAIHRQAAVEETRRADAARDQVMLLLRSASSQPSSGGPEARRLLDRASTTILADLDAGRTVDPVLLSVLAEFYALLDDAKGAEPLLSHALTAAERDGSKADAARAEQALAAVRSSQGKLGEARRLLDRARAVWDQDPARHARARIEARAIEATLLRQEGRREEAIALLEPLADEADALGGIESTEGTVVLNNLGVHLLEAKRTEEAAAVLTRAWKRIEARGQLATPLGLSLAMNRAVIALVQGRSAEAEAAFHDTLARRLALFGPSNATAFAQLNLARLLTARNAEAEALPLLDDALHTAIDTGGANSETTVAARLARSAVLLTLGKLDEAREEIDRCLAAAGSGLGRTHPMYPAALALRARVALQQRRFGNAQVDLDAADALWREIGGPVAAAQRPTIAALRAELTAVRGAR